MRKQIGQVILDSTYYTGEDKYSDGEIEDVLLDVVKRGEQQKILYSDNRWPILYHLSDIRENLLEWYPFREDANILEIGSGCGALTGLFSRKVRHVTCIELSKKRSLINAYRNQDCANVEIFLGNFQDIEVKEKYDYITLIGVWEYSGLYVSSKEPYKEMLKKVQGLLKDEGKIIIAIENKMGLKYWNGAVEDHTGNLYDGLNDYANTDQMVRTFSKPEIEDIFQDVGIDRYSFYYPMPDYKIPEKIYSDCFLPVPGMERNYGKDYGGNRIYQFNDAIISDQVSKDGMFSYFANSFLIITGEDKVEKHFAKYGRCRKEEFRVKTELFEKDNCRYIKKQALNEQAKQHILCLKENERKWKSCLPNLHYLEGYIDGEDYVTPFIDGEDLEVYFYRYRNDIELFIEKFCYYKEKYLLPDNQKFDVFHVTEDFISIFGDLYPQNQRTLNCTNIDLIFSNLKLATNGELYCFDYEWVFDFPIPYDYVIWRSAMQLYSQYRAYLMKHMTIDEFLVRAGIEKKDLSIYMKMEQHFSEYVFGIQQRECYLKNYKQKTVRQTIRFA
ncbi:MAG: class I SAM-dependent methyltransferase [Bacteroidales bacterium]|nr:class I SAM-dependent methyltransferase [Clostridium sp.]MCM1204365.1 class I SAM-dependent methyltransferase [Bacteroidales bacterium]